MYHKDSVNIVVLKLTLVVSAVIMFCLHFGCHGSLELDQLILNSMVTM